MSKEHRTVTASTSTIRRIQAGAAGSKTSVSGGTLTWSENDILNIVPQSGSIAAAALDIKSGVGESSGTFEGQIDASITDATQLYGWCGGSWTYNEGAFTVDMPATQTYVENGLAENAYPSIGTGTIKDGISLSNPMGVLKLSVKGETTDLVKSISVTSAANNLAGAFVVDPSSSFAVSGGSSKTITLNVASPYVALSSTGVNFYIVLPPAEYASSDLTVTVTKSDDSSFSNTFADAVTVIANTATAKEVKKVFVFTVDEMNTKVSFSKGNLQATYNDGSYTFGFAAHQYDFIGNNAGNTSINSQSNGAIVDLFGYSSTTSTFPYGISTSTNNSHYGDYNHFNDWGTAIDNKGTWRTLTKTEWYYLLTTRGTGDRYYKMDVTVCGIVNCLVIAPDGNETDIAAEYNADTWAEAEKKGFVCLPSSGARSGSSVSQIGVSGNYWVAPVPDVNYYRMFFNKTQWGTPNVGRYGGMSVRLVSNAN